MKNTAELVFILDKSGSMAGLEKDTVGGFNSMLQKQEGLDGECRITTVLFDNHYELLHDRIDIQAGQSYDRQGVSGGRFNGFADAIGLTIQKMASVQKNTAEEYRAGKVMFVIISDGGENSSREFSAERVKQMIELEKERYGWEFVFLGANIDAVETAGHFGIAPQMAVDFIAGEDGVELNYEAMSDAVACFREVSVVPQAPLERIRKDRKKRWGRKLN